MEGPGSQLLGVFILLSRPGSTQVKKRVNRILTDCNWCSDGNIREARENNKGSDFREGD